MCKPYTLFRSLITFDYGEEGVKSLGDKIVAT